MATRTLFERATETRDAPSESCTTAEPGKNGYVPPGSCNAYYNYNPEFEPAVAVAVIFGLLTLTHVTLGFYFRKRFTWTLIMGVLWLTISFTLHSLGSQDQQVSAYAVAWQLLFLLAPLWINAFVFMTFARVVNYYMPDKRVWKIKSHIMSKYYVLADVSCFIVQAAGGIMMSPGSDQKVVDIGVNVYIAGMALQLVAISTFIVLMVLFHMRSMRMEREGSTFNQGKRSWKPLLMALYIVLVCIMVRIIYRLVEFIPGFNEDNELMTEEVYPYTLDVLPMGLAAVTLAIFHPGRYLQGPDSEFPKRSRAEKKAEKRAKKEAKLKNNKIEKDYISAPSSNSSLSTAPSHGYQRDPEAAYNPRYAAPHHQDPRGHVDPRYQGQQPPNGYGAYGQQQYR